MAVPKTAPGTKLVLQLGDGGTPTEVFTAPCGLVSKTIEFAKTMNDEVVPDCDAPEDMAWLVRTGDSMGLTVAASGLLATDLLEEYFDWFKQALSRNCKLIWSLPAADGGGTFTGAFHLTGFTITGERGRRTSVELNIASDGPVAWADAAA